jgi:hypothetical protein
LLSDSEKPGGTTKWALSNWASSTHGWSPQLPVSVSDALTVEFSHRELSAADQKMS